MPHPNRTSPPPTIAGAAVATAGATTTDAVTGVSTGMSWVVTPGTYMLSAHLNHTSAINTTAPQFAMVRSGGCTLTYGSLISHVSIGGLTTESGNVVSTSDGFTQGQAGAGATDRPITITGQFVVATAGRLTLTLRSEVGGSDVTIVRGCGTLTRIV